MRSHSCAMLSRPIDLHFDRLDARVEDPWGLIQQFINRHVKINTTAVAFYYACK